MSLIHETCIAISVSDLVCGSCLLVASLFQRLTPTATGITHFPNSIVICWGKRQTYVGLSHRCYFTSHSRHLDLVAYFGIEQNLVDFFFPMIITYNIHTHVYSYH